MDQMGVERPVELSVWVPAQMMRKVDRTSVVVGKDLGTRDDKVKVSVKKATADVESASERMVSSAVTFVLAAATVRLMLAAGTPLS